MSAVGGIGDRTGIVAALLRRLELNGRCALTTLRRALRSRVPWPTPASMALATAIAVAAIVATMALLDASLLAFAQRLPAMVVDAFNDFTDFGRASWFLWPTALILLALAMLDVTALPRFARGVLAAWAVRLGFVFTAVALPSLFATIVKRLIGRARPFVGGDDVWNYWPLVWRVEYASFPSGHATTAFAALVAVGAIFPQARALMWIYAVLIAVSRVVITAHHPSDVLAGAIVGALGALMVRNWFAARRLGFSVGPDGAVHPMPGPSWPRIVKAIARRQRSA